MCNGAAAMRNDEEASSQMGMHTMQSIAARRLHAAVVASVCVVIVVGGADCQAAPLLLSSLSTLHSSLYSVHPPTQLAGSRTAHGCDTDCCCCNLAAVRVSKSAAPSRNTVPNANSDWRAKRYG